LPLWIQRPTTPDGNGDLTSALLLKASGYPSGRPRQSRSSYASFGSSPEPVARP
jgi:hypothetical protein